MAQTKKTIVLAVGTFDVIHLGHIDYLKQASTLGDTLVVVVSSDKRCHKRSKKSYFTEKERQQMVDALKVVDKTVIGHEEDVFGIVNELKPDVICIGHDSQITKKTILDNLDASYKPKIVKAKVFHADKYNTTKIKEKYS
jgi:FAD synthetase